MGAFRQTADRSKRSWLPVVSPSRRPLDVRDQRVETALLLTMRNTPLERLKLANGAKAPATLPGPADPSARRRTAGGRCRASPSG